MDDKNPERFEDLTFDRREQPEAAAAAAVRAQLC